MPDAARHRLRAAALRPVRRQRLLAAAVAVVLAAALRVARRQAQPRERRQAPAAPAPGRGGLLPAVQASIPRQDITNKAGEWNDLDVVIDTTLFRPWINTSPATAGGSVGITEEMGKFGPVALYVGGTGAASFRDVSYKDVNLKRFVKEEVSANFRKQQLTPFQYAVVAGGGGHRSRRRPRHLRRPRTCSSVRTTSPRARFTAR